MLRPQHTARAAWTAPASSKANEPIMSVGDMFSLLDGEQSRACVNERQRGIEQAQRFLVTGPPSPLAFTSFLGRPHTAAPDFGARPPTCSSGDGDASRPLSAQIVRDMNEGDSSGDEDLYDAESAQSIEMTDYDDVSTMSPVYYSAQPMYRRVTPSKACMRSETAFDKSRENTASYLSRQCCDVLGPQSCHQCGLVGRRQRDGVRSQQFLLYPNLQPTEENFSAALLVSKACPHLDPRQVQSKLVCGDISRPGIERLIERRKRDARKTRGGTPENDEHKQLVQSAPSVTKTGSLDEPSNTPFFTSIKDLNLKLIGGYRRIRRKGQRIDQESEQKPKKSLRDLSFTELVNPAFVSPKRVPKPREPRYRAFYDPPLLPKVSQNVEPAFFAGNE